MNHNSPPADNVQQQTADNDEPQRQHELVACTWTSASYRIRGKAGHEVTDGESRLKEWIEYHLMVGFDHIYIYDNSGAESSLAPVTDLFPSHQVTRIDWPCRICNNWKPANADPGERSSQYAAEASCLNRFGSHTKWLASFDIDEYMVPLGEHHKSMKDVLNQFHERHRILSFKSIRAKFRTDKGRPIVLDGDRHCNKGKKPPCLVPNTTNLQAYNCEPVELPKPKWAARAQKQIYRTDYVQHHFVHYSAITRDTLRIENDELAIDEVKHEAMMLHAKAVVPSNTANRETERGCLGHTNCNMGTPWPGNVVSETDLKEKGTGMMYNCFVNDVIERKWVPMLEEALKKRSKART
mmetsp:Transcript_2724/g.3896  ORF Transcript_2724/g.3896 Transcript_2724/m.3896 type:complete len:353 (-) Transcript_2724:22-1080(-)